MAAVQETVDRVRRIDVDQYRYGFETLIESDKAPKGLSEDTVRFISEKKNEPAWMLEWRLEAFRRWLTMTEPKWARVHYPKIDYQDLYYYSAPKPKKTIGSLDEVDPEILKTYKSSAFRSAKSRCWKALCVPRASGASPSMRYSIRCQSRPRSRRN
jgi:Fe-S cluster assembly protein SufB